MILESVRQLKVEPSQLTQAAPDAIDGDLFTLVKGRFQQEDLLKRAMHRLHTHLDESRYRGRIRYWAKTDAQVLERAREIAEQGKQQRFELSVVEDLHAYEAIQEDIRALDELRKPYDAEYTRRNGWTRAYLVDNVDGHVHKTTECPTWRFTTRFHWLTELSGQSEEEIVSQAGERACTVCYPSAPIDVLKRSSQIEGPAQQAAREAKQQREEEKRQRDAAKAAKAITNPDGSPLRTHYGVINTVVTAWREVVDNVVSEIAYGYDRRQDENTRIIAALAAKLDQHPDKIKDDVRAKAIAKLKRDGYGHRADALYTYSF